jgi:uncharacterized delta-60 repeat protein
MGRGAGGLFGLLRPKPAGRQRVGDPFQRCAGFEPLEERALLSVGGTLDKSFDGDGKVVTPVQVFEGGGSSWAHQVAVQSDGKIVVACHGPAAGADIAVMRFNRDGSPDSAFDGDGRVTTSIGTLSSGVESVAIQADGKIVVAGQASDGNKVVFALMRFNRDGSLDSSFGDHGQVTTDFGQGSVLLRGMALQSDGKIVVAGGTWDREIGSNHDFALARYNRDGSLDASFDGDGKLTTRFDRDSGATGVAVQADGKIVAVGSANQVHPGVIISVPGATVLDFALARYNADGSLDTSFDGDGKTTADIDGPVEYCSASSVAVQADGKIVVTGDYGNISNSGLAVLRFRADGSLDASFDGDGKVSTDLLWSRAGSGAVQTDGKIVVVGCDQVYDDVFLWHFVLAVTRFNADGSLDKSFDGDGRLTAVFGDAESMADGVAIQRDGRIVVAGEYAGGGVEASVALARLNANGSLDKSFDGDGKVIATVPMSRDSGSDVAIQPDGKIVVAGSSYDGSGNALAVTRYSPDGTLDKSFSGDGKAITAVDGIPGQSVAIQADGKIVVAGQSGGCFAVVRYKANGILDTSFGSRGIVTTNFGSGYSLQLGVAIQADGKIVVAGGCYTNRYGFGVARYNADGSLDTSFDGDGKVFTYFGSGPSAGYSVAIEADGKIVVAGKAMDQKWKVAAARYNPDGSLDSTFDGDGRVATDVGPGDAVGYSVAIQADGKVVVAGTSTNGLDQDFALVRYNPDGSLDTSLSGDGKVVTDFGTPADAGRSVAILGDGRIVVAGNSGSEAETPGRKFALAWYKADGSLDTAMDGGGKTITDFGPGNEEAASVAVQADGKIVVAGTAQAHSSADSGYGSGFAVARYEPGKLSTILVTNTNDRGAASLRSAIELANATPGVQTIRFQIPGAGTHTIRPASPLPSISDAVILDGTTQPGFSGTPLIELDGDRAGAGADGLRVIGGNSVVKGLAVNRFAGDGIELVGAGHSIIQGNYLGTDAAGMVDRGNGAYGVRITDSSGNTIGGTSAAARNVISGNDAGGVLLSGAKAKANLVQGNFIGVNKGGTAALKNRSYGVCISGASGNTIGGTAAGAGNLISGNGSAGVYVASGVGNSILANAIHGNGGLGIDLGKLGVTPNDSKDSDTGANNLQNFPVITKVTVSGGTTTISGTLKGMPNTVARLEFYSNVSADPGGYGEGRTFFARLENVRTDGSGNASFSLRLSRDLSGSTISATATDSGGSTSEFSKAVAVPKSAKAVTRSQAEGLSNNAAGKQTTPVGPVAASLASSVLLGNVVAAATDRLMANDVGWLLSPIAAQGDSLRQI